MARFRRPLVALAALVFAYGYLVPPPGDNEKAHYALVRSLAHGTPRLDDTLRDPAFRTVDVTRYKGHRYAAKAPGLALASLPAYLAVQAVAPDRVLDRPTDGIFVLRLWGVVLPAVVLLLLVRWFVETLEPGTGTVAAATLGGATLVLPFATVFFSHLLAAALGFAAFAALRRERVGPARLPLLPLAGLLGGLGVTTDYSLALVVLVLGVYAVARQPAVRRATAFAGGVALGLVPTFAFDWWAFGNPFHLSYEGWHAPGSTPLHGFFGLAFPSFRTLVELLFFPGGIAPIALPALVGVVLLWRRARAETAVVGALTTGFLLTNAAFINPFGGASPGPRYLIPLLPFLAVTLATAWRMFPGATLGLAVGGAAYMAGATATEPLAAWDHQVVHRLTTGGYVGTALGFAGLHAPKLVLLFFAALAVAGIAALLATPELHVSKREVAAAVAALGGWAVLGTQTPRLLAHGMPGALLAAGVALAGAAVVAAIYRFTPSPPRRLVPVRSGR